MKILNFKFVTTALFLLLALFAAGFTAKNVAGPIPQTEIVSVQQTVTNESLGDGFALSFEADAALPG